MRKFITLLLIALTLVSLATPTFAYNPDYDVHQHDWDVINWGDETDMMCECGIVVTTPHDSLFCLHEMVDVQTSRTHGTECLYCGFTIRKDHSWEYDWEYEEDGEYYHDAWCTECGYERTHHLISYHTDTEHRMYCNRCDITIGHQLSYNSCNRWCHEVWCHCGYVFYEAHNLNEDGICVECELYTGMYTGCHTIFDKYGNALENQMFFLIDGEEEMFIVDEYPDEIEQGDIVTFVHSFEYLDEIIEVISPETIDEEAIFTVEDDDALEWLWWNDFHALNYDASTHNTENGQIVYVEVNVGDEVVVIEPANPLQDTIYYIVN